MSASGDVFISTELSIPAWELNESFVRASGPGGQNVNKVSTAVQLRWNIEASSLPPAIKARFRRRYGARITGDGDVIVEAKNHRSQKLNRDEARKRLADMVRAVEHPPKRRKKTKPTYGSIKRRLATKKQRGTLKSLRGKVSDDD